MEWIEIIYFGSLLIVMGFYMLARYIGKLECRLVKNINELNAALTKIETILLENSGWTLIKKEGLSSYFEKKKDK